MQTARGFRASESLEQAVARVRLRGIRRSLEAALERRGFATNLVFTDLEAVRYKPGGFIRHHVDGGPAGPRRFSIVTFLNDDFAGGELVFYEPTLWIRPKRGLVVVFPSHWPHSGERVRKGTKFVAVGWLMKPRRGA